LVKNKAARLISLGAGVREDSSLKDSHSAALKLIGELTDLRSNHSDLIEAEEKAKKDLQMKIQDRVKLKEQIQQQTVLNENYQKQIQALDSSSFASEGTCGRCPEKWNLLDSSCYFFSYIESSYVTKSWQDSRMDCIGREADLIVIDSTEEQMLFLPLMTGGISTIYKMSGGRNVWEMGFWIGLTDRETEGRWVWINNVTEVDRRWEVLKYWMDGEPNNIGQHGEDCGVTSYNTYDNIRKTRFDSFCRNNRYWICERKSSLGVS
uniref:C-type lectin domain-containing protein n=1 Tax=Oryzias melastigma TaxID=30732 RepID=A0A3B3CN88_ORYME